jgi:hypothetical protein
VSLYSQKQLETIRIGSSANLYDKIRSLYESFEEAIEKKRISDFYYVAIKQDVLVSVLGDELASNDVKQVVASELNAMAVTNSSKTFYLTPGYTNNEYVF